MKLLIVSHWFVSKDSNGKIHVPGGTERYSYGLAKQLQKDGYDVTVLSTATNKEEAFEALDGINTYKFKPPHKFYGYIIEFLSFLNTLKVIKKFNPDIVHVVSCRYRFAFGAIAASKIMKKKTVYSAALPPKLHTSNLLLRFFNFFASKLIGRCNIIISPSMEVKDILAHQLNPKKIVVIPNFITKNYHRKTKKEKNSILFVGRLEIKQKGIDLLIHALHYVRKEIPNVNLYIIGQGNSLGYLKNLAAEYELRENIIFLGYVDDYELANMYSKCEIFVFPSLYESFGIVVIEAMSAGLPIVSHNLDCVSEIFDGGKYGILVKKGDVEGLADQIIKLLKDDELREYYSKMSLERSKKYTQVEIVRSIEKVYLNLYYGDD
ncbi:glycosyltransferase family 4 protein [candidate division WOR-3 bacterium]|nr:glycosyltransferase family 4 protein [candidate division WOR-3 bacterium]